MGGRAYTAVQLMQIVGEKHVQLVPEVSVTGAGASAGLVEALVCGLLRKQGGPEAGAKEQPG